MGHLAKKSCNTSAIVPQGTPDKMPKQSKDVPTSYALQKKKLAEQIGAPIQRRRQELKLSQGELRRRLQLEGVFISRSRQSRVEQGEALPSAAEIIAYCLTLNAKFEWLLLGKE